MVFHLIYVVLVFLKVRPLMFAFLDVDFCMVSDYLSEYFILEIELVDLEDGERSFVCIEVAFSYCVSFNSSPGVMEYIVCI